jgi:hypothetical protein
MNIRQYITFLMMGLFSGLASGGTILDYVQDEKYLDYAKKIDCVVQIHGSQDHKISSQFSGVIIHPNWLITAAHTIDKKSNFYFTLESGEIINIDESYVHPKYDKDKFGTMDIALCYFKQKAEISFMPELYEDNDEVGKIACIVGFGMTGNGLTGAVKWDNKKRGGSNFIDSIDNNMLICSMSNKYQKVTALEFCISSGDSGGGLFINKKLAGINSCVIHKNKTLKSKYGDSSGHTRISDKDCISWIKYIIYEQ